MGPRETLRRNEAPVPAGRPGTRGITWLLLVALLAAGTSAGFLLGRSRPYGAAQDEPARAATGADPAAGLAAAQDLRERMLGLDPFIVNLLGDDGPRYLKVRVELEADSPEARAELEARLPQVRDGILTVLGTRDVAEASAVEGRTLLKRDLEARLNTLLRAGRVQSVLFTEYVVQ